MLIYEVNMFNVNDHVRFIGDSEPEYDFIANEGINIGDKGIVIDTKNYVGDYSVLVEFIKDEGVIRVAFKECELEKI